MTTRKPRKPHPDDVVPDLQSEAFQSLLNDYQTGKRVSAKGMTREEFIAALKGSRKPRA